MTWHHIKPSRELMLNEQWIFRTKENVPACSLKRDRMPPFDWEASILNRNGISTVLHYIDATTPEEAAQKAEVLIREKGWTSEMDKD